MLGVVLLLVMLYKILRNLLEFKPVQTYIFLNKNRFFLRKALILISRIILVFYCKCCNLIGYSTRYLFLDR